MTRSNFILESVQLVYCKFHKINFKRGGSYIDSPYWTKKKKATINQKNKNDKCFQCVAMVALNHREIKSNPESVSNIEPFINKYKKVLE